MSVETDERVDLEVWMDKDVPCFVDRKPATWRITLRCVVTDSRPICEGCREAIVADEMHITNRGGGCAQDHWHSYGDEPRLLHIDPL